jgi:hypothetical protein
MGKKKVKSLLLVGYIMSHIENSSPWWRLDSAKKQDDDQKK